MTPYPPPISPRHPATQDRITSTHGPAPVKSILLELQRRIGVHNVVVVAAGIAFYGLLTLIPVLTALVATYALFSDAADIESQVTEAAGALDGSTQELITEQMTDIVESMQGSATIVVIGSILVALFSASGTVQKLLAAINTAYEHADTRPGWQARLLSFGFTAAAIVGVVVLLTLISAAPLILDQVDLGGGAELAIGLARLPIALLLFVIGLTVLYRYGPDRRPRTPWRNPGALVAGGLFLVFALALSIYTSSVGGLPPSYGLLGSVAVLMIFLQLTAVAVIIGAEVNAAVEEANAADTAATAVRRELGRRPVNEVVAEAEPLSLGKAVGGLVALFVFGRR